MRSERNLQDAVLAGFARREQGILVVPGNPLRIKVIRDLFTARMRVAVRPPGAGVQLLLESLLMHENVDLAKLNIVALACRTAPDVAQVVRSGRADCGIATRSVANAARLDFVSLTWERFDLVVRQRDFFRPAM